MLSDFDTVASKNVLPVLQILKEDSDDDVTFYANQALQHYTE